MHCNETNRDMSEWKNLPFDNNIMKIKRRSKKLCRFFILKESFFGIFFNPGFFYGVIFNPGFRRQWNVALRKKLDIVTRHILRIYPW